MKNNTKISSSNLGIAKIKLITKSLLIGTAALLISSCTSDETDLREDIESNQSSAQLVRAAPAVGDYYIYSKRNNDFLTVSGSNVITNSNQQTIWRLVRDGSATNGHALYKIYKIFADGRSSGEVLDVSGRSTQNGANATTYRNMTSNDDNQRWYLNWDTAQSAFIISSYNGGKALDLNISSQNGSISNVHMWSLGGGSNQRWVLNKKQ